MIETLEEFNRATTRSAAIKRVYNAIMWALGSAQAEHLYGHLTDEDLKDVGALDDALQNLGYTRKNLEADLDEYQSQVEYGVAL